MNVQDKLNHKPYVNVIYHYKYLILAVVLIGVTGTAIFGYLTLPSYEASALLKPGSYVGENGNVLPVITPEALEQVIAQGSFNANIEKSLTFPVGHPFFIKAMLPKGSNIIKVFIDVKNPKEGEEIINALLSQLTTYYAKEKSEKNNALSCKYLSALNIQLPQVESYLIDHFNMKKKLINNRATLLQGQDQVRKELNYKEDEASRRNNEAELAVKEKELAKLRQDIINIKKQIEVTETIMKDGSGVEIVRAVTVVNRGFKERMIKYVCTSLVISFIAAVLLAFIIFDIKAKDEHR